MHGFAALYLIVGASAQILPNAAQGQAADRSAQRSRPALVESASARASVRILRPAIFDFDAVEGHHVQAEGARYTVSRNAAGTLRVDFE